MLSKNQRHIKLHKTIF